MRRRVERRWKRPRQRHRRPGAPCSGFTLSAGRTDRPKSKLEGWTIPAFMNRPGEAPRCVGPEVIPTGEALSPSVPRTSSGCGVSGCAGRPCRAQDRMSPLHSRLRNRRHGTTSTRSTTRGLPSLHTISAHRRRLRRRAGRPVGILIDSSVLIAATAVLHEDAVATRDLRSFPWIRGLRVLRW